ncbi:hypothetical protein GOP47_0025144 [Adiantum capillus-veneris]|uniref:Uncharacterized protein n=1 Tax=Adiantum capillus-veneris TaxID=13818 RepID=A0A9D4U338_ADICA|nr:hypothetical protein GOP47_0025144 [Adiantum capillus-veneris]
MKRERERESPNKLAPLQAPVTLYISLSSNWVLACLTSLGWLLTSPSPPSLKPLPCYAAHAVCHLIDGAILFMSHLYKGALNSPIICNCALCNTRPPKPTSFSRGF